MRAAPEQYREAVLRAAAEGKDVHKAEDPRPAAAAELELRELAEAGCHREVVETWAQLRNAIAADHAEILAQVDAPAEATTKRVADHERRVSAARADLAQRLGVRQWVQARTTPADWEFARLHATPPRPVADADADADADASTSSTPERPRRRPPRCRRNRTLHVPCPSRSRRPRPNVRPGASRSVRPGAPPPGPENRVPVRVAATMRAGTRSAGMTGSAPPLRVAFGAARYGAPPA